MISDTGEAYNTLWSPPLCHAGGCLAHSVCRQAPGGTGSGWGNQGPPASTGFIQTRSHWHWCGEGGAWHRSETTDVMMKADGSGDSSQDRKVFVRRAEPMPTARAARDGQIRESNSAAGRGIFHIASIPRGGRRCRNPLSPLIKTLKRRKNESSLFSHKSEYNTSLAPQPCVLFRLWMGV